MSEEQKEPVKQEKPDYNDGTWYVPAGSSKFIKKPVKKAKKKKAEHTGEGEA